MQPRWLLVDDVFPRVLFRFGMDRETREDLAKQANEAEQNGLPHEVSVFSRTSRPDAMAARWEDISATFVIHKTGRNRFHYTVELPKQLTDEVADRFNALFERTMST